jgi:hypothetical protein
MGECAVGQRVARKEGELGTVVEIDQGGVVKVKWDRGRTSYYHGVPANVRLVDVEAPAQAPSANAVDDAMDRIVEEGPGKTPSKENEVR